MRVSSSASHGCCCTLVANGWPTWASAYGLFAAIVGGGFAEELQRAFVLTRFEQAFGRAGLILAIAVDTMVFALGHLYQGVVGALYVGVLGSVCVVVFLSSRRVADAMVAHA